METPELHIENKFKLAILAARRAKQLVNGARKKIDMIAENPLTVAMEEINQGRIGFQEYVEEEMELSRMASIMEKEEANAARMASLRAAVRALSDEDEDEDESDDELDDEDEDEDDIDDDDEDEDDDDEDEDDDDDDEDDEDDDKNGWEDDSDDDLDSVDEGEEGADAQLSR